ncbi:MAG TPA: glycogen debranching N-terminal domain-containing protein, partial [Phycisphaerae bacterium]|nr:glycogen debranching N-terminal domain-containing protein [Phycisphaerae bacterium]
MKRTHKPPPEEIIRVGDQFYVLAASSRADDRTRVLKSGDTFGLFDRQGDIQPVGLGEQGLYHEGTRFLSRMELLLSGVRPLLLTSGVDEENLVLSVHLTNPDLSDENGVVTPRGSVHLFRSRTLLDSTLYERLVVHNFSSQPFGLRLALHFDSDFADMFEVRGVQRDRRGRRLEPKLDRGKTILSYDGLDDVRRRITIASRPQPTHLASDHFEFESSIAPRDQLEIEIEITCASGDETSPTSIEFAGAYQQAQERSEQLRTSECEVYTSNEHFNDWLSRSRADLRMMMTQTAQGPYPQAGIPWFCTPFGRDGIITA